MTCAHCRNHIDDGTVWIYRESKPWHPKCYNEARSRMQRAEPELTGSAFWVG